MCRSLWRTADNRTIRNKCHQRRLHTTQCTEIKGNLQQHHVCQWGAQLYPVSPLSRFVGKPPFKPLLSNNVLPLTTAAYGPNSVILLTQPFDRIMFYVCNGRYFGVQKAENEDRGRIVFTATLRVPYAQYDFFIKNWMFLELFLFAKRIKVLTKGGIHCISRSSLDRTDGA